MTYHDLSTTKYWLQSAKQEIREHRRQKNREAMRAFSMFAFTAMVAITCIIAMKTMPAWLPTVEAFVAEQSWIESSIVAVSDFFSENVVNKFAK